MPNLSATRTWKNLTPTTPTASLDIATEINDPFKDAPAAPEALSEQSLLPAGGLPDLAEAVEDGAIVMPDEAAHTAPSEIQDDSPDEQDLPPTSDAAAASSATTDDITPGRADVHMPGAPDPSDVAAAEGLATSTKPPARKRGRPPKERAPPDLPQRASDPTVVEDCIAKLLKLNGRDLHTDMERGHVLNTLQASCADGAEFAKVVRSGHAFPASKPLT